VIYQVLAKTTLAYVVAKYCGYRIEEIDAGDDRPAPAIEGMVLGEVQMNSVTSMLGDR
jgi:hypothetical protein